MAEEFLVRDFMTTPAASIAHDSTLLDAALLLRRSGFRHLPVVEGERVVGIITDRDIHRLAPSLLNTITPEEYNSVFENTPLERVMTRNPLTISPASPVREAAEILCNKKFGCLPVVEDDRLVGILTVTDLLGLLLRLLPAAQEKVLSGKR